MEDDPDGLAVLDRLLDAWSTQPGIGACLGNETGYYVGTVIVKHVPGARWRVWPNGHPANYWVDFVVDAHTGRWIRGEAGYASSIARSGKR